MPAEEERDVFNVRPRITDAGDDQKELDSMITNRDIFLNEKKTCPELGVVRSWVKEKGYFPKISDNVLILFLNASFYDVNNCKKAIEKYFTIRTVCTSLFRNRDLAADIADVFKIAYFCPFPMTYKTPDGCRVTLFKFRDPDPPKFDFTTAVRTALAMIDMECMQNAPSPGGVITVFDMTGLQLAHIKTLNLSTLKYGMQYSQEAMPVKLKRIHIINSYSIVSLALATFKPFLKEAVANIIHIHTAKEMDEFYKLVPQRLMPEDYGGTLDSVEVLHERTRNRMLKALPYLKHMESFTIDDKIKSLKKNSFKEINQTNTSFKQLTID